jgi:hypothetical protein
MPATKVRIINPEFAFEKAPGFIVEIFPGANGQFGVFFPRSLVSWRYHTGGMER